ncbi:MAG: hypothetical protein HGA71_11880 [Azonexaceae bacterium]|nr:hypothetical protein [Azonexaceae bacterium]
MVPDYMQKYTDLRIGKMSFQQFMEFVDEIYCMGQTNGCLSAQSELLKRINSQMSSAGASCDSPIVPYESVF